MNLILSEILSEQDLVFNEDDVLDAVNKLGYETYAKHDSKLKGYLVSDKTQHKTSRNSSRIPFESDFKYEVKNKKFEQYNINKPKAA